MASSGGHLLVAKATRLLRFGIEKATRIIRDKLPQVAQPLETQAKPAYARIATRSQPANRIAAIRQSQSRSFSTKSIDNGARHFGTSASKSRPSRASFPSSQTRSRIAQSTGRAPFASTLRPNLTGGVLNRSAGGYNTGAGRIKGVRYFSHGPAAPAEVVQNVSQAVRAFWLSGQKAHFNGHNPQTGEKRYRAVSNLQDQARHTLDRSRFDVAGSFVDFKVSPTITAVGPLASIPRCPAESCEAATSEDNVLTNTNLITTLEVDFARALKDLAAIMNDLKHLSSLGSLPIVLVGHTTLRVRFPGCDRDTVEGLCRELNIRRGIVGQDEDFDERNGTEMALMFPFAPSNAPSETFNVVFENENERPVKRMRKNDLDWGDMVSDELSHRSATSHDLLDDGEIVENPWLLTPSGYSSLHASEAANDDVAAMFFQPPAHSRQYHSRSTKSQSHAAGYEGLEGIYKFLEQCDTARR